MQTSSEVSQSLLSSALIADNTLASMQTSAIGFAASVTARAARPPRLPTQTSTVLRRGQSTSTRKRRRRDSRCGAGSLTVRACGGSSRSRARSNLVYLRVVPRDNAKDLDPLVISLKGGKLRVSTAGTST